MSEIVVMRQLFYRLFSNPDCSHKIQERASEFPMPSHKPLAQAMHYSTLSHSTHRNIDVHAYNTITCNKSNHKGRFDRFLRLAARRLKVHKSPYPYIFL
ncbi:hypothetical protein EON65_16370 [archaeon]|nr:MAG: hypothetical protein EON65_16370 [archaeon]